MLGQKEEKDLQQCILQYLKHKGLQSTFESMKKELEMEDDPEYDHLLEIKWSTLNMYEQRVQQSNELTSNSIKSFVGHKMGLTCVKFHPTLDLLFSCGEDQTIRVWDVEDGLQATFTGHSGTVTCLSYRNGLIASSSLDGTLRIWSTHTERLIKHINTDTPLLSVVFMDDETIACGGRDGVLRIIQLDGTVKLLHGHTDPIKALDAKQYLVSADKSIIIWNLDDLSIKGQLFGHEHVIECVHVLESESLPFLQLHGTFLASCSRDKTIRLWNLTTMEHVYTFEGHNSWVRSLSSKDNLLVSVSDDKTVKFWDLRKGICTETFQAHDQFITCCDVSSNSLLATGSADKTVHLWGN